MKIGVNLPATSELAALGPGGLAAAARHAEQLGFESVSMRDLERPRPPQNRIARGAEQRFAA